MKDYMIVDIATLLKASKNISWKDDVINTYTALFTFLKNNDLLVDIEPFDIDNKLKIDLYVKKSNFTEEGYLLKKKFVDKWYDYLDRTTDPDKYKDLTILEKGLKKIRLELNKQNKYL